MGEKHFCDGHANLLDKICNKHPCEKSLGVSDAFHFIKVYCTLTINTHIYPNLLRIFYSVKETHVMNFPKHIMQRASLKQGESLILFAKITSEEPQGKISSQQMLLRASVDYN